MITKPLPGIALSVLQEDVSLEARLHAINDAIWRRNDNEPEESSRWYSVDVFDGFAIVRRGRALLKVPYTTGDDGVIAFGEPEQVEVEYRPLRLQESELRLIAASDGDPEGLDWDVTIIRPGLSKNGLYYPAETLRQAAPLFEGVHVFVFDDDAREHKANPLDKTQKKLAGWIDGVKSDADGALAGTLHFLQEGVASEVRAKLVDAWKRGKRDLLGLSIDARGTTRQETVGGKMVRLVESILKALSVEVVMQPAAGGQFTRLVASATATPSQEVGMRKGKLLRLLEARRPDALAGVDRATVSFGELAEIATEEEIQEAFRETPATQVAETPTPDPVLQEAHRMASRSMLGMMLQESRLPELVQKRIQKRLTGQVLTEAQIQAAIDEEREYAASLNPARVTVPGAPTVRVGAEKLDRLQAAFDRACGVEPEAAELRTIQPLGLRGLYNQITLGHDPQVNGILSESAQAEMLQETFTNASLPRVVANTLYRRLLKDYREVDYGERRIISVRPGVTDFKTQEAIRVGYLGDIATVDPEAADYAEITKYGEESATYAVGQRGNLLTITRKHILNDDVGHIAKVVGRLGRAARRTFARFVWTFVTSNPNIYKDGAAWFRVENNNLLTAALSIAQLDAAEAALFNQAELSSDEKLGLRPSLLVVPIELKPLAYRINQTDRDLGNANNDANPWHHAFGEKNENILVSPFFTDANDWAVFASIMEGDIIEVAFMNGQEEPEFWLADSPTVGQMFVADKLQYKIRHEYGGAVVDFRTAVKSVVA